MTNPNDPAYPCYEKYLGPNHTVLGGFPQGGLTKLEVFTMAAMQGQIANPSINNSLISEEEIACLSIKYAKATLAELAKES